NFKFETETFSNQAVFLIAARLRPDAPPGPLQLTAQTRYQTCNDTECRRPKKGAATFALVIDPAAPSPPAFAAPPGYAPPGQAHASPAPSPAQTESGGLGAFALAAFGFGLLAIFTPCVFPMIPVTVSFFLNQRGGVLQASVFSLGIVVLFCSLGLGVTAAVGPFGIAQLGSNPWVNAFIALVFGVFALSLLGAFEMSLPSRLLTALDRASRRGGYLGSLLMGLTFSLASFACIGPFVGSLLASSVQAKGAQPVVGMLSFAMGLASPFFFLAASPGYLKKLPKSGGWLARVKIVMGFVLLALMLKYFSNIDQVLQAGVLTRERFLAAWFVLFSLPGLYLLGLLRLEGVELEDRLGIGRLLAASAFLIFSLMLLPGMFGVPLGELDAYVPAPSAQAPLGGAAQARPVWMKNQYREALDRARQENKLILVNFTGYSCTNCKWMDANMFPRPEIASAVRDLIPVELYVDGVDAASEQNQKLEDDKFKTASMPYYALIDADERIVAQFAGATRDPAKFLMFLKTRPGA
ncbi:MAG TPA: cytochrome c biogenesis protein CcdA, partial [Bryobacteraceae bacterium]|nr:cytochrome c biogenesis protein CcdA [Bryobacteraceae bacterium]